MSVFSLLGELEFESSLSIVVKKKKKKSQQVNADLKPQQGEIVT